MTGGADGATVITDRIERMLHERIGLDPTTVGSSLVQRAVRRRMEVTGIESVAAYEARLSTAQEVQELVEEVVIPETYFFREPEALDAVAERAVHGELRSTPAQPLRVLSAPCSTGEEPYSIAMTLLAAGASHDAVTIDAVDLSREAVRRAREAVYRGAAFRSTEERWFRFFREVAGGRAVRDDVRAMVRVQQGNLLDTAFVAPRSSYNVIFCRNLLIYFDVETQARVLATLTSLLASDGVLVVGAADTFAVRRAGFLPVPGAERSFLFQYRGAEVEVCRPEQSEGNAPGKARAKGAGPSLRPGRQPNRKGAVPAKPPARKSVPPTKQADRETAPTLRPLAEEIARLANAGRLADAIQLGEGALSSTDATAELHAIMGTTYDATGDEARAEACYRRALYLDPSHTDALLHLALTLDRRGDASAANRLRARARRRLADDAGGAA